MVVLAIALNKGNSLDSQTIPITNRQLAITCYQLLTNVAVMSISAQS
ncbi:MAG: hypothetical protein QNJ63_05465 [Calothrix sp. MO_192.B10]|nr:hypothetical protein [Calothrix sp. MO_192.B10]